jgi:hypothetical protein
MACWSGSEGIVPAPLLPSGALLLDPAGRDGGAADAAGGASIVDGGSSGAGPAVEIADAHSPPQLMPPEMQEERAAGAGSTRGAVVRTGSVATIAQPRLAR